MAARVRRRTERPESSSTVLMYSGQFQRPGEADNTPSGDDDFRSPHSSIVG